MGTIILYIILIIGNTILGVSNYKSQNYKTAMFSSFVVGFLICGVSVLIFFQNIL